MRHDPAMRPALARARSRAASALLIALALTALAPEAALHAASPAAAGDSPRPRVGIVLSGGGARGMAHLGVLRALDEMRVPIDAIAGASMGAVVGGLRAQGMSPDEIEAILTGVDWMDAFDDDPPRADRSFRRKSDDNLEHVDFKLGFDGRRLMIPPSAREGEKLRLMLDRECVRSAGIERFDDLPIPFRAVATDLTSGEQVVLDSGSLALAIRASVSIPALLAPVERDGKLLVDGGLVANLPVDVARSMNVDVLIAVDISSPVMTREEVSSVIGITKQLAGFLTIRNVQEQRARLRPADILIEPDLGELGTLSFENSQGAIAAGEAATRALAGRLAALALSPEAHAAWRARAQPAPAPAPLITAVRAETDSKIAADALAARVEHPLNAPLDSRQMSRDALDIYGLGVFEEVSWRLVKEASGHAVVVSARRRHWGPGYVQFGLGLEAETEGDSGFRLGAAYTLPELNRLGGELRTELQFGDEAVLSAELHQPLSKRMRLFFSPSAWTSRTTDTYYDDADDAVADYRQTDWGLSLEAGRELGEWGELRLGARRSGVEGEVTLGDPATPQGGFDLGSAFARLSMDELDDRRFPHRGFAGFIEYAASRPGLGADSGHDRVRLSALGAWTKGRGTFVGSIEVVDTFEGSPTFAERVELGGFLRLSGLREDQIEGDDLGLVRLAWYRRLGRSKRWPTQAGFSLEAGNTWGVTEAPSLKTLIPAGSVFLAYDSPVGAVYLGGGWAEGGRQALYLSLGRSF